MKNRIALLIKSEGLTSSKFADSIGVQRSSISHILSGRNKPSLDFVQKVLNTFTSVNIGWLISGKGEMYEKKSAPKMFDKSSHDEADVQTAPKPYATKENKESQQIPDSAFDTDVKPYISNKQIEKVVVFYTDKTFKEYNPV